MSRGAVVHVFSLLSTLLCAGALKVAYMRDKAKLPYQLTRRAIIAQHRGSLAAAFDRLQSGAEMSTAFTLTSIRGK